VRRKRKARHPLSGKPVPNPLPRSAVVEEAPGHEGKWRARPSDSQGHDLTHEKSRRDPHLARAEPDEAVRTGRNITRIALVPFTAQDVKCTWDMLSGKSSEKLRLNPRKAWYRNIQEVTTNGDDEVTFNLGRPQPALLALLASAWAPI